MTGVNESSRCYWHFIIDFRVILVITAITHAYEHTWTLTLTNSAILTLPFPTTH